MRNKTVTWDMTVLGRKISKDIQDLCQEYWEAGFSAKHLVKGELRKANIKAETYKNLWEQAEQRVQELKEEKKK